VDVVTDFEAVAVDESCGVLDKELKVEASADYADYRVTGLLFFLYYLFLLI